MGRKRITFLEESDFDEQHFSLTVKKYMRFPDTAVSHKTLNHKAVDFHV